MRAFILSIGSELLLGHITDTNATFLAQDLAANGIDLVRVAHVGDDLDDIVDALTSALDRADIVICTGGIGPTDDDLTREAIAAIVDETPVIDEDELARLRAFFAGRGQAMPERNAKQAWTIPSAEILANPVGTAPGWYVRVGDDPKIVIAMPGVPREMYRMWREQARPRLLRLRGLVALDTVTLKTIGIGESAAEQAIHDLVVCPNPVVATYAKDDGVHIRVTARADAAQEAAALRAGAVRQVEEILGPYIWGRNEDTLPDVILRALRAVGATIAVHEVGTGGHLTALLTSSPEAIGVLRGSSVEADIAAGTTTGSALMEMAESIRQARGASVGLAMSFSGEPDEHGLWRGTVAVALCGLDGAPSVAPPAPFRAMLPEIHRRAALHAADVLRRAIPRQVAAEARS